MFKLLINNIDISEYIPKDGLSEVTVQSEGRLLWTFWMDSINVEIYESFINKFSDFDSLDWLYNKESNLYYNNNKIFTGQIKRIDYNVKKEIYNLNLESNGYILGKSYLFQDAKEMYAAYDANWQGQPNFLFNTKKTASGDSVEEILNYMREELINNDFPNGDSHSWFNKFSVNVKHNANFIQYYNYFLDNTTVSFSTKNNDISYIWGLNYYFDKRKPVGIFEHPDYNNNNKYLLLKGGDSPDLDYYSFHKIDLSDNSIEIDDKKNYEVFSHDSGYIDDGDFKVLSGTGTLVAVWEQYGIDEKPPLKHLIAILKQHLENETEGQEYSFQHFIGISDTIDGISRDIIQRYYIKRNDENSIEVKENNIKSLYHYDNKMVIVFDIDINYERGYYDNDNVFITSDNYYWSRNGSIKKRAFCGFSLQGKDKLFYEYEGGIQAQSIMKDMAKITNSYIYIDQENIINIVDRDGYNIENIEVNDNDIIDKEQSVKYYDESFDIPSSIIAEGKYSQSLKKRIYDFYENYLSGKFLVTDIKVINSSNNICENVVGKTINDYGIIKKQTFKDETIEIRAEKRL